MGWSAEDWGGLLCAGSMALAGLVFVAAMCWDQVRRR